MVLRFAEILACAVVVAACGETSQPRRIETPDNDSTRTAPPSEDVCIVAGDRSIPCTKRINDFVEKRSELAKLRGRRDASKFLLYLLESTERAGCFKAIDAALRFGLEMRSNYKDYCDSLFTVGPFRRRDFAEADNSDELLQRLKGSLETMYEVGWEEVAPYTVLKDQVLRSWKDGCVKLLLRLVPMPAPANQRRIVEACILDRPDVNGLLALPASAEQ